jgi:hypothetical protein
LESIQHTAKPLSLQTQLQQKPLVALKKNSKSGIMAKKQAAPDRDIDSAVASRGGGVPKTEETYSPLVTLRRTIFPIYGPQEVTKFLLIGTIKFFIIMALTLTRDTKDTLVVTQCGAEAIAFLKVCYVGACIILHARQRRIRLWRVFANHFWPSTFLDLRCPARRNRLHCPLFQNVKRHGQANAVLHDLHPILRLFRSFRHFHLSLC